MLNEGAKSRFVNCRLTAVAIWRRPWPALTHQRPAGVDHLAAVDGGVVHAFGGSEQPRRFLNCRLAVNGIQNESVCRVFGF